MSITIRTYTEDEILIEATLMFPDDERLVGPDADRIKAKIKKLCPPGMNACHVSWGNKIGCILPYAKDQRMPNRISIINAFHEEFLLWMSSMSKKKGENEC